VGTAGARGTTLTEPVPVPQGRSRVRSVPPGATGGVGGILLGLGLPPLALPPLAVLGVGAFVLLVARAPGPRQAAIGGMAFGFCASLVSLHWVPAAAEPYLGIGGALGAGFSVWLLHAAVGGVAAAMAASLAGSLPLALRAGAGFGVLEWLPGAIPVVGIPWFGVAATLTGWPALLPLVAASGSGGLGILVAAAWGAGLEARRARGPALVTALTLAVVGAGSVALARASPGERPVEVPPEAQLGVPGTPPPVLRSVAALEWSRTRHEAADPAALRAGVEAMLDAPLPTPAEGAGPTGMLWPEAPLPTLAGDDALALRYLERVQESGAAVRGEPALATADRPVVVPGAVAGIHADVAGRRYNTLVRTGSRAEAPEGVHRKTHLVPGVERTVLTSPGRQGRGLAPGAGALPFEWGGVRAGGLICFEILYPVEVARLRRRGAELLVQSTSDAMLQPGGPFPVVADAARRQHEAVVRLRAAEFRLPVIRAALGGRAVGVSPDGREIAPTETFEVTGGRWQVFPLVAAASSPPAAWIAPLVGPLMLGLLLVPLVFQWRRAQVVTVGR
jgi:apolipoprotein N-acyltransferase